MIEILFLLIAVIAVFITVILLRAIAFRPTEQLNIKDEDVIFDKDKVVENLCEFIKCKTVSYKDKNLQNNLEFTKLKNLLYVLYPNLMKETLEIDLGENGMLFRWKGQRSDSVTVLMAHYDVVPADESSWTYPPFSAKIVDENIYGRGAVDTKITLNAILFASETLINNNFTPENDIYFAFSGEEEVNGAYALNVVEYFEKNNINIGFVLDEGGAVVNNVFPGVYRPCALVGIAEKGMVNVSFKVVSDGGHASSPKRNTSIGILSKACYKIERNPLRARFSKPVYDMFDNLGRYSTFKYKIIFANLWCFKWLLDLISKKNGKDMNAMLRTTVAFTQMKGSPSPNVMPSVAEMVANVRINIGDDLLGTIKKLNDVVNDEKVQILALDGYNPSAVSKTQQEYEKIKSAIIKTYGDVIVSPYLMVQCSDSRHYSKISDKVYRFSACELTNEERNSVHGNDEKIRISSVIKTVEFFIRLIKSC